MTVESITPDHLDVISTWWESRGDGCHASGVLPPDGFVASDDEGPLVAAWLYRPVGCQVGIIDWLVSRPGHRSLYIRPAARAVFSAIERLAETKGIRHLFASVSRSGMIHEAQACGFHIASTENTHLVKSL